jgi:iron complex outermembrane recepter protein
MQREFRDQFRTNNDWSFVANLNAPVATRGIGLHRLLIGAEYAAQDHEFRFAAARQVERGGPVPPLDLFNPDYRRIEPAIYGLQPSNFSTDTAKTGRAGFYAQDYVRFNRFVQFTLSGRVDHYNDKGFSGGPLRSDDTAYTGRAGLVIKPLEALSLYGNFANSFIRPGILYQTPAANGPFPPETGNQVEFGAKAEVLNRRLNMSAAAFRIRKNDILRPDPNLGPSGTNLNAVQALGGAVSRGIELNVEGFLTRAWYFSSNYTYLHTEITSDIVGSLIGQPLPNAAPHTFGLFTRYDFLRNTGVSIGIEAVDDRVEPFAGIRAGGYAIADLGIYQKISESSRVQIQVTNLFDRTYAVTSLFAARAGKLPGQPRAVTVTVALRPFR